MNKGKLYELKAYSKTLKRFVSLAVWYPMDGRTDKWQLNFSTDNTECTGCFGLLQDTFPTQILLS